MTTPPYLRENDIVGLIAPAKNFDRLDLEQGIEILKGWGLRVKLGQNLFNQYGPFAGVDQERAEDLQCMLDNDDIRAIFCVRGGYGCNRIIDSINWQNFERSPKWIVGFSDITVMHCTIQRMNVESIHAIMPLQFGKSGTEVSVDNLKKVLFGEGVDYTIDFSKLNRLGDAHGQIIGGNLAILCSVLGTSSDFDTDNKILFLEDVGEYLYRLDRMIVQLKRADKLANLSGLIVGHLSEMVDNNVAFGNDANGIIYDAIKDYNYPVCFNFPVGHEPLNLPMIVGRRASLLIETTGTKLTFQNYSL